MTWLLIGIGVVLLVVAWVARPGSLRTLARSNRSPEISTSAASGVGVTVFLGALLVIAFALALLVMFDVIKGDDDAQKWATGVLGAVLGIITTHFGGQLKTTGDKA